MNPGTLPICISLPILVEYLDYPFVYCNTVLCVSFRSNSREGRSMASRRLIQDVNAYRMKIDRAVGIVSVSPLS